MPEITAEQLAARKHLSITVLGEQCYIWAVTQAEHDLIIAALREHEGRAEGYWVGDKNGDSHLVIDGSVAGSVTPVAGQFCTYIDSCPVWRYESLAAAKAAVEKAVRNG